MHKRMLFELLPDLFPPFLTDLERLLWDRYYTDMAARSKAHGN